MLILASFDHLHDGAGIVYQATWGGMPVAVTKLRGDVMNPDFESEMFSQEIGVFRVTLSSYNIGQM